MIVVENLCFDYPGKRALNQVSFTLAPHTITALVGPNGAGKTTLLRCLAALETPTLGKIHIDKWDVEENPRQIHAIASYLSDFFGLYDELTIEQHFRFFAWSRGLQNESSLTETAKLLNILDKWHTPAGHLSRGQRQSLAIALTILHQPKIIFLDEPAAGLDPEARYHLSMLLLALQKQGMTILVSSHILAELEDYSTHMLVLKEGEIIEQCALNPSQRMQDVYLNIMQNTPAKE